jgi:hypothetical protein
VVKQNAFEWKPIIKHLFFFIAPLHPLSTSSPSLYTFSNQDFSDIEIFQPLFLNILFNYKASALSSTLSYLHIVYKKLLSKKYSLKSEYFFFNTFLAQQSFPNPFPIAKKNFCKVSIYHLFKN